MYEKITFVVSGKVQGVCFRAYAQKAAQEMDVTGWVKNRADYRVEGEAHGSPEAMERFIAWLHKGSPHGRVDQVDVDRLGSSEKRPASFTVKY